ncbi:MAG TPA: 50S ribosomal protein L18 [Candidatus Woesearchaeota archaeon]|nr:MAG: 50S ribosomal protein L18 [Candidatus Woesearchaeota archaeon]HDD70558.1 50S ribosomal protein L18 [Candidatus Woesearchaeota archaeon]
MKNFKTRTVYYRRSRSGKTNYRQRLKLLLSKKPRVVVRRSSRFIRAQFVEFFDVGDKVLVSVDSKALVKVGWKGALNNMPSAYLLGLLFAKKVGNKECVLDIGLQTSLKGGVIYSFVKGCIDGGLKIPCAESMFPPEDVISGKNIADFAKFLKADKEKFKRQFSKVSERLDPEKIVDHFKEVKQKILGK